MVGGVEGVLGPALRALPLKDMDGSLLTFAILGESADLGVDTGRLAPALALAAYLHRDDLRNRRKQLPVDAYVTHPFRLVLRLARYGCRDTAVLCAAALHDTVEDHPDELVALLDGTADPVPSPPGPARAEALTRLAAAFGADVARIVAAVTNPPSPPGPDDEERLRAYRAHVEEVIADPQVFLVKVADFIDNAGSLHHMVDTGRRARLERKYRPLLPALGAALERHQPLLGLADDGPEQIAAHLDAIECRTSSDPGEPPSP